MLRSIGAIIVGYLVFAIFIGATNLTLSSMLSQSSGMAWMVAILALNVLGTIPAGYAAARIAGRAETMHALATGIILTVFAIIALTMNPGSPLWFRVAQVIIPIPGTLLGGKMRALRRANEEQAAEQGTAI